MKQGLPLAAVAWAATIASAAAIAGCGGNQTKASAPENRQADKRGAALACMTGEKKLDAHAVGKDAIQVDGDTGPHVRFFLTGGEAEADQFEGHAEGSEQIGSALLFPRRGSDELVEQVEDCLTSL
jgi:hypothetical protein